MQRNPHASINKKPITREQVQELRQRLERFWEDTALVTKPNGYHIIEVGNLAAMLDTLLQCNDFDNPQMTLSANG